MVLISRKVEPSREGVAPSPTSWCSSYRKGSLRVTLDYGRQLYFYITWPKKLKLLKVTNVMCNIEVVGVLTCCALLQEVCYLKAALMNVVQSQIHELVIYSIELGHTVADTDLFTSVLSGTMISSETKANLAPLNHYPRRQRFALLWPQLQRAFCSDFKSHFLILWPRDNSAPTPSNLHTYGFHLSLEKMN